MTGLAQSHELNETEVLRLLDSGDLDASTLAGFAFRSFKLNRRIALHPNAAPELLARLAESPDRLTQRNVTLNAETPKEVLLRLAPRFPGEFFANPVFDWLLMEDPNLLFTLPVGVLKNILKRDDCPAALLEWAVARGDRSHHLALLGRDDLSEGVLRRIASGPHAKASEIAAERLIAGEFVLPESSSSRTKP